MIINVIKKSNYFTMNNRQDAKKFKTSIVLRDNFKCTCCEQTIFREEYEIHHVIPLSQGGANYPSNLVTLCSKCHSYIHKQIDLLYEKINHYGCRRKP